MALDCKNWKGRASDFSLTYDPDGVRSNNVLEIVCKEMLVCGICDSAYRNAFFVRSLAVPFVTLCLVHRISKNSIVSRA